ncbi:MAG: Ku protein [Phycisphaerales bacterium JB039]
MAPRAMWTGQLRLSLVSFGVRLYSATESSGKVSMNQLHKDCHQRVRNQLVCPTHGPIGRDEIVKGYEYEKDSYVIIEQEDLDKIRLESTKTIELTEFVDEGDIDPLYVDSPYFLGPDGKVAEEAFNVIHEALKKTGKVGIGRVVMYGRERIVALKPEGRGFLLTTLRYAGEVRSSADLFKDIKVGEVDEEQLELATSIIEKKAAEFDPSEFTDRYQEAFFDIVKAKVEGEEPVIVDEEATPRSFNFMDALRQSVEEAEQEKAARKKPDKKTEKKPAAASKKAPAKKPAARSATGDTQKKTRKKRA